MINNVARLDNLTMLPEFLTEISVTYDKLPVVLDGVTARGVLWQVAPERFLLNIPSVASYLVTSGSSIIIDRSPDSNVTSVIKNLGMLPLAALIYQRGLLAFHAAAVANEKYAFLIAGGSGAGKSTVLTALLKRGWSMMADDLVAVDMDRNGQLFVHSTDPSIALWPETIKKFGITSISSHYCDANRQLLYLPEQSIQSTRPLHSIFWLGVHNKSCFSLEKLSATACFRAVSAFLYNSHIADVLCNKMNYMHYAAGISNNVPIHCLQRPRGKWSVDDLTNSIDFSLCGAQN